NNLKKIPGINLTVLKERMLESRGLLIGSQTLRPCYPEMEASDWDFCVPAVFKNKEMQFSPLERYLWKQSMINCQHCFQLCQSHFMGFDRHAAAKGFRISSATHKNREFCLELMRLHNYGSGANLEAKKQALYPPHYSSGEDSELA